jgi:hypothetical protein
LKSYCYHFIIVHCIQAKNASLERLHLFLFVASIAYWEMFMLSKIVLPIFLISCLAGCAAHQDSYSKAIGLPDTTESKKE